jgi:L-ascorbate metabolism protein UlaG (beta-lactamase superfamily)
MSGGSGSLKTYALKHLRWYGQSAFRIAADSGETLAIDPFRMPASAGPADMILVTHPHFDHYDKRAIAGLRTRTTTVVVPQSCARHDLEGIRPGQTIRIGALSVSAIPAYTTSLPFHPRARGWVGYLIEVDGLKIYHAGDTDLIPEMKGLQPDIALLPIGGFFTMKASAAAAAAESLKAALVIPMHYIRLLGGKEAGSRFVEMLGEKGMVLPVA